MSSILLLCLGIAQRYGHVWQQWTRWIHPVVAKFTKWFTRYGLRPLNNCPDKASEMKTSEKVYRVDGRGRFLKRSLRPDEYPILSNGEPLAPLLVVERLQNEAACMQYIRENTDIPVPKVLDAYAENGSYFLWMEYIDGIEMSELTEEEQVKVIPQGE